MSVHLWLLLSHRGPQSYCLCVASRKPSFRQWSLFLQLIDLFFIQDGYRQPLLCFLVSSLELLKVFLNELQADPVLAPVPSSQVPVDQHDSILPVCLVLGTQFVVKYLVSVRTIPGSSADGLEPPVPLVRRTSFPLLPLPRPAPQQKKTKSNRSWFFLTCSAASLQFQLRYLFHLYSLPS